jgi:hypothetical protein
MRSDKLVLLSKAIIAGEGSMAVWVSIHCEGGLRKMTENPIKYMYKQILA